MFLWFFSHINACPGYKVFDKFRHFNPNMIRATVHNDVYFCTLPLNATHFMQSLDVAVSKSFKISWRTILHNFRKKCRMKGTSKRFTQVCWNNCGIKFHLQLQTIWFQIFVSTNYPRNPEEPMKHLPGVQTQSVHGKNRQSVNPGDWLSSLSSDRGEVIASSQSNSSSSSSSESESDLCAGCNVEFVKTHFCMYCDVFVILEVAPFASRSGCK